MTSRLHPPFVHDDFLLTSESARRLYHGYAATQPIIDYHCHLSPALIAEDQRFESLTRLWLDGDHYKWRAMRTCGVDERFVTGDASDWEKFQRWAETVPKTLRNPLYHWTHLELARPFGIRDRLLAPDTAREIWDVCNSMLATPEFSAGGLLAQMQVEVVCTTDDPADDLRWHRRIASDPRFKPRVYPAFRPDQALAFEDPAVYAAYLARLGEAADLEVRSYADLIGALDRRHQYFHENHCRVSDHGLETIYAEEYGEREVSTAFAALLAGDRLDETAALKLKSAVLYELALMHHRRGWVQQLHLGALRNTNSRMLRKLGPDSGFDSIGDLELARPLARFLDRLDRDDRLARTVLYNLNPRDNELMATMIGNFQDGSAPGKLQYGAAWWFLDQRDGMTRQLEALSNMGLLSQFIGMLTDSRSFVSYSRHEYFRRLLCEILGDEMERGVLPKDWALLGAMVEDICYRNARRYFAFPEPVPAGARSAPRAVASVGSGSSSGTLHEG